MKVKTRFLLGLGIMMMLALLLISVGWYQLQNIKQLSRELEQRHDAFILAQDIQQSVKDVAISLDRKSVV